MPLSPGQVLNNRYRIVKLLGQGGFGAVYRAWDTNLDEPVALKESFETSPTAQKQFQLEAKLLFKLHHTNLPRVHDYFVLPGQGMYLVMDYIEGEDLGEMLQKAGGPLPEAQVLQWAGQICDALSYLHAQNPPIIHRDIKPANIRITPEGRAMLVDFGIAKVFDDTLKTTTGARALTPGFAPLEQYGQGKTDARTDIYALGSTLYALLAGQRPPESVQRTIHDALVPPEQLNPLLSGSLAGVIRRAMEMDPDRRFQSAAEFKHALQSADQSDWIVSVAPAPVVAAHAHLGSRPPLPERRPPSPGLSRWVVAAGIGFLGLAGVIFLISVSLIFYNRFGKEDAGISPTPSTEASETAPAASTQDGQPTDRPALTPTTEILPTGTLFVQADMPEDIPLMPGAENLQVFGVTQGNMVQLSYNVQASDAEIIAFYEREMPAYGWEKVGVFSDDKNQIIYFKKDTRVAMVMIAHTSGQTIVSITITQK